MPVIHVGSRPTRMRSASCQVLDEKVVRNRRHTREHAVSGGVRLKALSRVVTTVSEL